MPLSIRGIRTITDLFRAGAGRFVEGLYQRGLYGAEVLKRLTQRFPDALARSKQALVDRVISARSVARWMFRHQDAAPSRSDVPINPSIPDAYQVTYEISWIDYDGNYDARLISVHFDHAPTHLEACKEAIQEMMSLYGPTGSRIRDTAPLKQDEMAELRCKPMSIYRRT